MRAAALSLGLLCASCATAGRAPAAPSPGPALAAPSPARPVTVPSAPGPPAAPPIAMPAPASMPVDPACRGCTQALDERACRGCGGRWDVGILGRGHCACPTPDGGRVCRTSAECHRMCELPWEIAVGFAGTRCSATGCEGPRAREGLPLGRCATHAKTFGCQGWLIDQPGPSGPWRETRYLCTD